MNDKMFTLAELLEHERRLVFGSFTNDRAIALGSHIIDEARKQEHAVTVDVTRGGHQLFHAALSGTSVDNDHWVKRKRNVVERFGHSSLYMAQLCEEQGADLAIRFQLNPLDFAPFGGSFPILVQDVGVVGTVTVSGLPHELDHSFVTNELERFLFPEKVGLMNLKSEMSFYLAVGDEVVINRTVTDPDLITFANLSGDHSPNHIDQEAMSASVYKRRIAHGAFLIALMSACSTAIVERAPGARRTETPVSLGYDRIRFIRPVFVGDALVLRYTISAINTRRRRSQAAFKIEDQDGQVVCIGDHHLKWVANV